MTDVGFVVKRPGLYITKSGLLAAVLEMSPEAPCYLDGFVQLGPVVLGEPLPARRKMVWLASGVALSKSDSLEGLDLEKQHE